MTALAYYGTELQLLSFTVLVFLILVQYLREGQSQEILTEGEGSVR